MSLKFFLLILALISVIVTVECKSLRAASNGKKAKKVSRKMKGDDDTHTAHDDDAEIVELKAAVKAYTKDEKTNTANLESVLADIETTKAAIASKEDEISDLQDQLEEQEDFYTLLLKQKKTDTKAIKNDEKSIKKALKKIEKLDEKWEKSQS